MILMILVQQVIKIVSLYLDFVLHMRVVCIYVDIETLEKRLSEHAGPERVCGHCC